MKKYIFKIFLSVAAILFIFSSQKGYSEEVKYHSNIEKDKIDEIFSTKIVGSDSITSDFPGWITNQKTYIVVKEDLHGDYSFWFNTPNLQKIAINKFYSIFPNGYVGEGRDVKKLHDSSMFKIYEMKDRDEAKTGLQKYGFHIPSIPYIGEYPMIEMSISGILVEDNPISFIVNKISSLFGGDIIKAPDTSDLKTLKYITPNDYEYRDNSFEKWLDLYWDKVKDEISDGQVMLTKSSDIDENGKDKSGNVWVWKNIVKDTEIYKLTSGADVDAAFKSYLGKYYSNFVLNLISLAVEKDQERSFENNPIRQMPYEMDSMIAEDKNNLVPDPRVYNNTNLGIAEIKNDLPRMFMTNLSIGVLDLFGEISSYTSFLNSLISMKVVKDSGIDITAFYNSDVIGWIFTMGVIAYAVYILSLLIKSVRGNSSMYNTLIKSIVGMFIVLFSMFVILKPESFYNSMDNITKYALNAESAVTSTNKEVSELISQGNADEQAAATYWIPYFSLWTEYNTNHTLAENVIDKSKYDSENEQNNMLYPKLNGEELLLWSANLADAWTDSDFKNDNQALRTVDHFMAPRIENLDVSKTPMFTTARNENYNGGYQGTLALNTMITILVLFLFVFIKLLFFSEFIFELLMFPINLAQSMVSQRILAGMFKNLGYAVLRIFVLSLAISLIIINGITNTTIAGAFITIFIVLGMYYFSKQAIRRRSKIVPKLFYALLKM